MRNSPMSFGGGHAEVALVSARLRVTEGGLESSRLALSGRSGFGAGRFLRHARFPCGNAAALAPLKLSHQLVL